MNDLLEKDFKQYLEEVKNPPKPIDISFFEWSNVDSAPLSFKTVDMFRNFLDSYGITYDESDFDFIKKEGTCYAACPKGSVTLLITKWKYELRNALSGNPVTTPRPCGTPYYPSAYGYGYEYDYYDND